MFIYLTTNKINNKKYIGYCTRNDDLYMGSGKLIKEALNKYGKDNFERIILEECNSIEELSKAEQKWIEHYDAVNSDEFYNLSEGGRGGNAHTVKRYWDSLTKKQRKERLSMWTYNKSGSNNPMFGRKHSDETKKLIGSKSVNRNWHHPDFFGAKNPKAKKAIVEHNGVIKNYDCLKDACDDFNISYSSLKTIAKSKTNYSKKHNIKVKYVD